MRPQYRFEILRSTITESTPLIMHVINAKSHLKKIYASLMNDLTVRITRNRRFLTIAASLFLNSSTTKADIVAFSPTNTITYQQTDRKFQTSIPTDNLLLHEQYSAFRSLVSEKFYHVHSHTTSSFNERPTLISHITAKPLLTGDLTMAKNTNIIKRNTRKQ